MATYKELRDNFFDEVSKIDLNKLNLSFGGGLKEYAELLKAMAEIPEMSYEERLKNPENYLGSIWSGTPRKMESEV